ncbi:tetratricopeptide repeat protein, partial [Candidatus Poribacteria bacterium]|nr:tetratricopeptide repeat protein [Candidatus Poribacteria bacterium]
MLTGTQTFLPKVVLPSKALEISSMPQLLDNAKLLQTPTSQPAVLPFYAENDYHWLVGVLDKLIGFMRRDENHSVPELTENDYDWAHALLVELVGAVGESETHPLRPLMAFVRQLIDNYEDKYVPELTELFPELAEEAPIETTHKSKQPASNIPKLSDIELAAHAFFSIGYLLYHGNRTEKAIPAYDTAIMLKPDFWEASYNLGIARYDLKQHTEAISNFNKAIELNHNFASAYYNRGIAKSKLDRHESAIADFDKAIALGLNSSQVYCLRASANARLGEYDAAVSDYDKVIELK